MLPALVATLLLLGSELHAQETLSGETHLWHGGVALGTLPPPLPGLHVGQRFRVGERVYQPHWRSDRSGSAPFLLDEHGQKLDSAIPARKELIILTTLALSSASRKLPLFIDLREAEGYEVTLVTERDWDVPVPQGRDTRQGRIRAWLQSHYAEKPGAFLLLIGDPDPVAGDVPMQLVHPIADLIRFYPESLASELNPIPTDFYYAELSASWDCDGDDAIGEYPDDADCMDAGPELFTGRLPIYNSSSRDLDELLERLIARDMEQDKSYRAQVLLPAALYGVAGAPSPGGGNYEEHDDGACITDALYRALPEAQQELAWRMYENDGLVQSLFPFDEPLDQDAVVQRWRDNPGMVLWCGHGSPEGVYRMIWDQDRDGDRLAQDSELSYPSFMQSDSSAELAWTSGAFTWQVSCDNGYPEEPDNLGAALLYGGAISTATASRPSIGGTSVFGEPWEARPDLATGADDGWYFMVKLLEGLRVGEAMAWTKYALSGDGWDQGIWDYTGYVWLTRFEFNLYGDPTRSLELCARDEDCDDGSACTGRESCRDGYCVHEQLVECDLAAKEDCMRSACDDSTGACVPVEAFDGSACEDGLYCTSEDTCAAGTCSGQERFCGEREGYTFWCSEEADSCLWEQESTVDDPPVQEKCGSCAHQGRDPTWLLALCALFASRRRHAARALS